MSADPTQPAVPTSAPRGYFPVDDYVAPRGYAGETPVVSKSGELPAPLRAPAERRPPISDDIYEGRVLIATALRREGFSHEEIAQQTGLTKGQIRYAFIQLRKSGRLEDVESMLNLRARPQAVENLITALEDPTNANHWDATLETLHGTGALRKFNTNRTEGAPGDRLPSLQIAIINPDGGRELPTVIINSEVGSVVGVARVDDDETT